MQTPRPVTATAIVVVALALLSGAVSAVNVDTDSSSITLSAGPPGLFATALADGRDQDASSVSGLNQHRVSTAFGSKSALVRALSTHQSIWRHHGRSLIMGLSTDELSPGEQASLLIEAGTCLQSLRYTL